MSKATTRRNRRHRRTAKGGRYGPNRGARHRLKSGRTGSAHRKKSQSKRTVVFVISVPRSLAHLMHFRVMR